MAKRKKLSAKQRKINKQRSYVKREYYRNVDAIKFLERFGAPSVQLKNTPTRITKASLKSIQRIYRETKKKIKLYAGDVVDYETGIVYDKVPTKSELAKLYRESQTEEAYVYNPDLEYIEDIKDKVRQLQPLRDSDKTEKNYNKNVLPKQQQIKDNFMQAIDDAIAKYGESIVAKSLAQNTFMQRIENLEEKYTYEIIEDMTEGDDALLKLIDASVSDALLHIGKK